MKDLSLLTDVVIPVLIFISVPTIIGIIALFLEKKRLKKFIKKHY